MLVVVTDAVKSRGSTFAGVARSFVVVRTAAGYGAGSGHAGTGTVVATVSA